jgi:hypothetical protein
MKRLGPPLQLMGPKPRCEISERGRRLLALWEGRGQDFRHFPFCRHLTHSGLPGRAPRRWMAFPSRSSARVGTKGAVATLAESIESGRHSIARFVHARSDRLA